MIILYIVYFTFGLILTLIALVYYKLVYSQKRIYNAMKAQGIGGEPFIPVIGQLLDMVRANNNDRGLEYFEELQKKHGSCFLFGFGPLTRLILLDAELISDAFSRSKAVNYHKPIDLSNILKPIIGQHNLVLSEDEEHDRVRKMLNPAFHFVNLRSMISIMTDETVKAIDSLMKNISTVDQLSVEENFSSLTLSIIATSAFGQSIETIPRGKEVIYRIFNEAKDLIAYRTLRMINQVKFLSELPFWGKRTLDNGVKVINDFANQAIVDRRSGKSMSACCGQDILDLLLSAVDDQGESLSDEQIKDEILTFLLAGHETTSNLLTWATYVLTTNEDVLRACREEVDRILPKGTIPTFEQISELSVIEAVLYETLRLYSPIPFFARECIREHSISNTDGSIQLRIPVGTTIVVQAHALHRCEKYWPRPLEFDYTRWLRNPTTGLKPKLTHPFAYAPFAVGPRNCIGQNFAILEAKIILSMLVQRCDFTLTPGQRIVREMNGITMRPKYGMHARFKERDA